MAELEVKNVYPTHPLDVDDPLFWPDDRHTALPVRYQNIKDLLISQRGSFWLEHEIKIQQLEIDQWNALSADEKHFLSMVLAFFASSDMIVNENLSERFSREIQVVEVKMLYNYQKMMEDIHSEVYAKLIDAYISNEAEKYRLFNAVKTVAIVGRKADWVYKWIHSTEPYAHRLVAMSAVEGIFFSGSFCAIYWIHERGILDGLCKSNKFISRDEGQHTDAAVEIHKLLKNKISEQTAKQIIHEAVALEIEFITEALPCRLIGMNSQSMAEYIKFVANRLLKQYGFTELYLKVSNPFDFMDRIGLGSKPNFFETKADAYNKLPTTEDDDPYAGVQK